MNVKSFPGIKAGRCRGFTMIEIAICLAIIGFAVVAVVGVLPTGLNIQRDTRERTQVLQDATYLADAIQQGAQGTNDLVPYIKKMWQVVRQGNNLSVEVLKSTDYDVDPKVIGLLSTRTGVVSNRVVATVALMRSLTGPSSDKTRNYEPEAGDPMGFDYFVITEVQPIESFGTNLFASDIIALDITDLRDRQRVLDVLHTNLHEVRMTMAWPAVGRDFEIDTKLRNQAVFRLMMAGTQTTNRFGYTRLDRRRLL